MDPVLRRLVVAFSVRNRRRKAAIMGDFMRQHRLRTVAVIGVSGDVTDANQDVVERALETHGTVVAAVCPWMAETRWPLVVGDGRCLPIQDRSVDVVVSNAVIEHVGFEEDQRVFVAEHVRVGRAWIITTPNRWFPVESHVSVLFRHWSPTWRAKHVEEFTRLLSRKEFRELLPMGATIVGRPWSPTFTAYGVS